MLAIRKLKFNYCIFTINDIEMTAVVPFDYQTCSIINAKHSTLSTDRRGLHIVH